MRKKQKEEAVETAKDGVDRLFRLAEKAACEGDLDLASRYVKMAWDIKLKFRVRLSDYQKRLFCRKCLRFLVDSKTGRYRTEKNRLVITCLDCGNVKRVPLSQRS